MIRTILAIVLAAVAAHAAEKPATTKGADAPSRFATIELKLDSQIVPLLPEKTVQHLNRRAAELAPNLLGINVENVGDWLELTWGAGQKGLSELTITVNVRDASARPAAGAFADAMVDALRQYQHELYEQKASETIPLAETRLAESRRKLDQAQARAADFRAKVRELSGRSDHNAVNDAVNKLEEEQSRLELDVLAKSARREALEKQIAEQSAMVEKRIGDDAIAMELLRVVDAREGNVDRIKQMAAQKAASVAEVSEAIGRAAEARAKYLERKRDAATEAGGDGLSALNRELLTLAVDLRELNARLEFVRARVPKLRSAMDMLDEFNRARRDANDANNRISETGRQLEEARMDLSKPPEITITSREVREKPHGEQGLFGNPEN